jgi:hypothetical protein
MDSVFALDIELLPHFNVDLLVVYRRRIFQVNLIFVGNDLLSGGMFTDDIDNVA